MNPAHSARTSAISWLVISVAASLGVGPARAALVAPVQRTLHAQASAFITGLADNILHADHDNPPDVVVGPILGTVEHSAVAMVDDERFPGFIESSEGSIHITTLVTPDRVVLATGSKNSYTTTGELSGASGTTTLVFDLTRGFPYQAVLFFHTPYAVFDIALTGDAGLVWSNEGFDSFDPQELRRDLLLDAGRYELTFDYSTEPAAGTTGGSQMRFDLIPLPEPATAMIIGLGVLAAAGRARRCPGRRCVQ